MNKILEILKKYNVIRVGAVAAKYKNARERPMALQDDMFIGKPEPGVKKGAPTAKFSPIKKLAIISLVLFFVFFILAMTSWLSWLVILIWIALMIYLWLTWTGKLVLKISISAVALLVVVVVFSFLLIIFTQTSSPKTATKPLTAAECKPYVDKYDGKIFNISSDGLQGTIGIKVDTSNPAACKLHGYYNVILSYNLPQNPYTRDIGPSYHYIVMLRGSGQNARTKYDGFGTLSPAYKNFTSMPDPFSGGQTRSNLYSQGSTATETRYFYWGYEIDINFSDARYQEILNDTKLDIVNGTPFIVEKGDGTSYSYSVDDDTAAVSGDIVKSYNLTITERQ